MNSSFTPINKNASGCDRYGTRCPMCLERHYEVCGFCRPCFHATAADARSKGRPVLAYVLELWENYNMIYSLNASPELQRVLANCRNGPYPLPDATIDLAERLHIQACLGIRPTSDAGANS